MILAIVFALMSFSSVSIILYCNYLGRCHKKESERTKLLLNEAVATEDVGEESLQKKSLTEAG